MELLTEYFDFIKTRKKFLLLPILIVLAIFAGLLIFASSGTVVAPFIYSLF